MSNKKRALFNWYWELQENGVSLDFAYGNNATSRVFDLKFGGKGRADRDIGESSKAKITEADSDGSDEDAAKVEDEQMDEETAYACLLAVEGVGKYSEEFARVRRLLQIWEKQGAPMQKRINALHTAIFCDKSDDHYDDLTAQFAKYYHAFLVAAGVLNKGSKVINHIGTEDNDNLNPKPTPGELHLIAGVPVLNDDSGSGSDSSSDSSSDASDEDNKNTHITDIMDDSGAVIVTAWPTDQELPDELSKGRINLRIYLQEMKTRDPMDEAQEYIGLWLKRYSGEMFIEESVRGRWSNTFAKRIVNRTEGKDADEMYKVLEEELKVVETRQASRLIRDPTGDPCEFTREDLLGEEPKLGSNVSGPWKELQDMIGLEQVKDSMKAFEAQVIVNHYRAMNGQQPAKFGLNRLFLGPPGTGKTTVGKLYGDILGSMGFLDPGGFELRNGSEFIEGYEGQSEVKTREILDETKGKVLMIDEAYILDPDMEGSGRQDTYRKGVLDTIVGACQNTASENRCVILAGYKGDVQKLLKANDGLPSRFPMEDAFVFEQFSYEQLKDVLQKKLRDREAEMTDEAFEWAMDALELGKQSRHFGNGRAVEKILDRSMGNYTLRLSRMTAEERRRVSEDGTVILPQDVDPKRVDLKDLDPIIDEVFEGMLGLEQVKENIFACRDLALSIRNRGHDMAQLMPFHFAFKGPNGTGRKTVARHMCKLYHSMRLLATDEVVETSVQELVQQRVNPGVTVGGRKTGFRNTMKEAVSRVLLIEDADQLFGGVNEQTKTIVQGLREEMAKEMNKSEFLGNVVVILVGLEQKLDRVLDLPGFGLFQQQLQFQGMTSEDCFNNLCALLEEKDIQVTVTSSTQQEIEQVFGWLCEQDEWSNYRDLNIIAKDLARSAFGRVDDNGNDTPSVTGDQILECLQTKFRKHLFRVQARARSETRRTTHKSSPSLEVPHPPVRASSAQPGLEGRDRSPIHFERVLTKEMSKSKPGIVVTNDDAQEPYKYRRMESDQHIRLLRLEPSPKHDDPIRCSTSQLELNEENAKREKYDALSYSWDSMERTSPIECEGGRLLVTRSCELALRYLRREDTTCTLWIDVVCINQDDKEEKSQQVPLMGDVYRFATRVFIWLGEDEDPDGGGLADLKALCDAYRDDIELEIDAEDNVKRFTTFNQMMKHRWWKRMWTFQEFVIAKEPIFVVGHVQIPWDEFSGVLLDLITQRHRREDESKKEYLKAAKSSVITQLLQDCGGIATELEQSVHMIPTWLEVMDVVACRSAYTYGMELPEERRQLFMSHYLLKTRNRSAGNPRDNIYGLHYLFKISGFNMPKPDYTLSVADVYKGAAEALLQQSASWWILSQLLNKREGTNLDLPSWVPDFSSRAIWHQGLDLRFQNVHKMIQSLEREEFEANERTSIDFDVQFTNNGLLTEAVFLWTVKRRTTDVRANPILDRAFEEEFEQANNDMLENTIEDFFFDLAEWLTIMEPQSGRQFNDETTNEPRPTESEVMEAIACTYWRSSWKFIRSFGKPTMPRESEDCDDELAAYMEELSRPDSLPRQACDFLCLILATVRSCMNPDPKHPCTACGAVDLHGGSPRAQDCFNKWINEQESEGLEGLKYVKYWLYSRAVDHSLFQTDSPAGCAGHFGFCRNSPRERDDIVLFPGLSDPVIIRKRGPDSYRVVGVTTGMIGPTLCDSDGHEVEGAYCLGHCSRLSDPEHYELRSFTLV